MCYLEWWRDNLNNNDFSKVSEGCLKKEDIDDIDEDGKLAKWIFAENIYPLLRTIGSGQYFLQLLQKNNSSSYELIRFYIIYLTVYNL